MTAVRSDHASSSASTADDSSQAGGDAGTHASDAPLPSSVVDGPAPAAAAAAVDDGDDDAVQHFSPSSTVALEPCRSKQTNQSIITLVIVIIHHHLIHPTNNINFHQFWLSNNTQTTPPPKKKLSQSNTVRVEHHNLNGWNYDSDNLSHRQASPRPLQAILNRDNGYQSSGNFSDWKLIKRVGRPARALSSFNARFTSEHDRSRPDDSLRVSSSICDLSQLTKPNNNNPIPLWKTILLTSLWLLWIKRCPERSFFNKVPVSDPAMGRLGRR